MLLPVLFAFCREPRAFWPLPDSVIGLLVGFFVFVAGCCVCFASLLLRALLFIFSLA